MPPNATVHREECAPRTHTHTPRSKRRRLDTDIAWGHATGMATLLVFTGLVSQADLGAARAAPGFQEPDFLMHSFGDLLAVREPALAPA